MEMVLDGLWSRDEKSVPLVSQAGSDNGADWKREKVAMLAL